MMFKTKNVKKIIGIWTIVCALVISALLLVSLIRSQEAYAEKKKISGTFKDLPRIAHARIFLAKKMTPIVLDVNRSVLSSSDPEWNNAQFFYFLYNEPTKDYDHTGYGVITHPSGDQTFIQFTNKITSSSSINAVGERKGRFIGGTGKFEGIRARWLVNWNEKTVGMMGDWKVEYF